MMQLSELHPEERSLVLGWMRESIENGIKKLVLSKAYYMFCEALKQDQSFDPDVVWNLLQPHQKEHFRRTAGALDLLDEMIDEADLEADKVDGVKVIEEEPADDLAELEGGPDDG